MTNPTPDVAELVTAARASVGALRDEARTLGQMPFRVRDEHVMAIHGALDKAEEVARAYEAMRMERDALTTQLVAAQTDVAGLRSDKAVLLKHADQAERDLAAVDAALARRPALDKPTRAANVAFACEENQRLADALLHAEIEHGNLRYAYSTSQTHRAEATARADQAEAALAAERGRREAVATVDAIASSRFADAERRMEQAEVARDAIAARLTQVETNLRDQHTINAAWQKRTYEAERDLAAARAEVAQAEAALAAERAAREQAEKRADALEYAVHDLCPMARRQHLLGAPAETVLREQISFLFWLEGARDKVCAELAAEQRRRETVEAKLAYITPALPVLKTMCEVAGLDAGASKAAEMIAALAAQAGEGNA